MSPFPFFVAKDVKYSRAGILENPWEIGVGPCNEGKSSLDAKEVKKSRKQGSQHFQLEAVQVILYIIQFTVHTPCPWEERRTTP